jgi:hypothetical protein
MTTQKTQKNWIQRNFGWLTLTFLGVGAIGDFVSGSQFIISLIDYFSFIYTPPVWYNIILIILLSLCVIVFIYYSKKTTSIPKVLNQITLSLITISLLLLTPQFFYEKQSRKFVLVFDEVEPKLNFPTDSMITVHIDEVSKLAQVNQFENATIISTISRPEIQWKKQFPNGNTFDSPIFSVQEVLNDASNNIVDISTLDYRKEIRQVIIEKQLVKDEIRIFFEVGFESVANNLKSSLKEQLPNSIINYIGFDKNDSKNLINKNVSCVFLTSNEFFKANIQSISEDKYKHMIVPNWMLSSLNNKNIKSNRHCVTKSLSFNLTNNNYEVWSRIISLIKSEDKNINLTNYNEIVRNKILTSFMSDNNIQIINF